MTRLRQVDPARNDVEVAFGVFGGACRTLLELMEQADPEQGIGSGEPRRGEPWILSKRYYNDAERSQCCTN
jgi:hypothetical protein